MKLAEALCARADLQKKIEQLRSRLECVVKIQEGDEPDERPEDLFAELHEAALQLEELIYRINRTNLQATHEGVSITKMIAKKDALTMEVTALRSVFKVAGEKESRYSRNEIKYVKTIDTAALRKKIDSLSAELRKTDIKIQELNWLVELEPNV